MEPIAEFIGYIVISIVILTAIAWLGQIMRKNGLFNFAQKGRISRKVTPPS